MRERRLEIVQRGSRIRVPGRANYAGAFQPFQERIRLLVAANRFQHGHRFPAIEDHYPLTGPHLLQVGAQTVFQLGNRRRNHLATLAIPKFSS